MLTGVGARKRTLVKTDRRDYLELQPKYKDSVLTTIFKTIRADPECVRPS